MSIKDEKKYQLQAYTYPSFLDWKWCDINDCGAPRVYVQGKKGCREADISGGSW